VEASTTATSRPLRLWPSVSTSLFRLTPIDAGERRSGCLSMGHGGYGSASSSENGNAFISLEVRELSPSPGNRPSPWLLRQQ